jgi:hypothetical protein
MRVTKRRIKAILIFNRAAMREIVLIKRSRTNNREINARIFKITVNFTVPSA